LSSITLKNNSTISLKIDLGQANIRNDYKREEKIDGTTQEYYKL
jgi:hypothetical protein